MLSPGLGSVPPCAGPTPLQAGASMGLLLRNVRTSPCSLARTGPVRWEGDLPGLPACSEIGGAVPCSCTHDLICLS